MGDLMRRWAEGLRVYAPQVSLAIESRGSVTGPPALIGGESDLAPMTRNMTSFEVAAFEKQYGYKPIFVRVALDALAVYVHKDNPIQGLTLQQVDGIFSSSQRCGGQALERWGDLVFGRLNATPISIVGRNKISGTYDYFRDSALCGGEFRAGYVELEGSVAVVNAVGSSIGTIGYAGIGFRTSTVRALPLAKWENEPYVAYDNEKHRDDPDLLKRYEPVISGRYPLSRFLYLYLNKPPGKPLPEALEKVVQYILSERGQKDVADGGFIPVPEKTLRAERAKLASDYRPSWWSGE
ncbi:phosphate ABC transporter substrate-binding protein [Nitrospira sp.]|nr:phosphate ABC transporter substrate-binding protein [Nitrospira sp.]